MKAGDKITFAFGDGTKEGVIEKLSAKKAYLRVDFPHHANKRIVRKISLLEAGAAGGKKKKEAGKKEKNKEKVKKEKVKKEKVK